MWLLINDIFPVVSNRCFVCSLSFRDNMKTKKKKIHRRLLRACDA